MNTNDIPKGPYCYDKNGICPYWESKTPTDPTLPKWQQPVSNYNDGYCHYLKKGD